MPNPPDTLADLDLGLEQMLEAQRGQGLLETFVHVLLLPTLVAERDDVALERHLHLARTQLANNRVAVPDLRRVFDQAAALAEQEGLLDTSARLRAEALEQCLALGAEAGETAVALARLGAAGAPVPLGGFALLRPLGQGGAATVWLARHHASRAQVAVKVLHQGVPHTQDLAAEVYAAAGLQHRHVTRELEFGTVGAAIQVPAQTPVHEALRRFLGVHGLAGEPLATWLHRRLGPQEAPGIAALLDAGASQGQLGGLASWLHRSATDRPLVLLLEGAGPDTGPLLQALSRSPIQGPVLAVVIQTPQASPLPGEPLDRIRLGPLPAPVLSQLLGFQLPLQEDLQQALVDRSGGNPAFALALLRELVARDDLVEAPGGFGTRPGTRLEMPQAPNRSPRPPIEATSHLSRPPSAPIRTLNPDWSRRPDIRPRLVRIYPSKGNTP